MSAQSRRTAGETPWPSLLAFAALCTLVAVVGGLVTASSVESWYPALAKPPFNPPDWIFGPVWTALYGTIALSGWRLWLRRERPGARRALAAWGLQLGLNLGWTLLFFGLRQPALALVEILALIAAIALTMALALRVCRLAAGLLVPYLGWVCFAAVLTFEIWRRN